MLGSGLASTVTRSPPPSATSRSTRSAQNARTAGSTEAACRGVNPRATRRRNAVWAGASCITIGGLSARPSASSSPYSTDRPPALLKVSASTAAASTSACRLSTK